MSGDVGDRVSGEMDGEVDVNGGAGGGEDVMVGAGRGSRDGRSPEGRFRLAGNVASILSSDVTIRAAAFVMYALVARQLGAHAFGQLTLAFTLFYVWRVIALAGLKPIVTRAVAGDPDRTAAWWVNASAVAVPATAVSLITLAIFIALVDYPRDTAIAIALLSVGLLPFAWSQVCEAIFQARERMHFIAYGNVPVHLAKLALVFAVLWRGYGIHAVILVNMAAFWVTLVVEWWLLARHIARPRPVIDLRFCRDMLASARTFLGIELAGSLKASVAGIMLSAVAGETAVGLFGAASQITVPLRLLFQNVVAGAYPMMCRRFESGVHGLQAVTERLLELLLAVSLPICLGIFVLADLVLLLLYRDPAFLAATTATRVLIWYPLTNVVTTLLGQAMWAGRREQATLRIGLVNLAIKAGACAVFIARRGVLGAALANVAVELISFAQHYGAVKHTLPKFSLIRSVWRPALAALAMALVIAVGLAGGMAPVLATAAGGLAYLAALMALIVWSFGGMPQARSEYLRF